MRIYSKLIVDIPTNTVIRQESCEYNGPIAQAVNFGGSKSKQKSQSSQQSTSESGTDMNQVLNTLRSLGAAPRRSADEIGGQLKSLEDEYTRISNLGQAAYPYGQGLEKQIQALKDERDTPNLNTPTYDPQFTRGTYTGANYTPVEGGDFARLEANLFGSQQSKLQQAYNQSVAKQREELAQMGALNSPSQYLEGSARSILEKALADSTQQAARDASSTVLGLKQQEAARKTGFDVGEATRKTGFDTSEAGRETEFNQRTAQTLLESFLRKLALALESGRFSIGQSTGQSTGSGSNIGGNFGFLSGGGGEGASGLSELGSWFV